MKHLPRRPARHLRQRIAALAIIAASALAAWCPAALRADTPAAAAPAALHFQFVEGEGGVPLNVVESGDPARPAILLVHGIGQSYVSWENQLAGSLPAQFHVVAFDLRGHGNSGKPWTTESYTDSRNWAGDVQRIITALKLDRPVLVGWSYGTLVVADYVRVFGTGGIRALVMTGAYGGLTPPPPPPPGDFAAQMQKNRGLQMSGNLEDNIAAARISAHWLTAKKMPDAWYDRATSLAMTLPLYARKSMFARSLANQEVVAKIAVPSLFIVGGKDGGMPEQQGRELVGKLPNSRLTVYAESGHSAFAEEPERFNAELAQFAREAFAH
jgi:pimeloyl-ACP methyl ester carboxylesterase